MSGTFLTARMPDGTTGWACVDPDSLCSSPAIRERRFASYLSPFPTEEDARRALLDAGADPGSIAAPLKSKSR